MSAPVSSTTTDTVLVARATFWKVATASKSASTSRLISVRPLRIGSAFRPALDE